MLRLKTKGIAAVIAVSLLAACSGGGSASGSATPSSVAPAATAGGESAAPAAMDPQTIRLPHCCADGSHFDVGAEKFAELVKEKTNGAITVEVFPGGQLGQEAEVIQNVQDGTIEVSLVGHDPLAGFAPITQVLSQPYVFRDTQHAFGVLDGEIGDEIEAELEAAGLLVLGWGDNGQRVYTTDAHQLETPADFEGLTFRSPQSPVNLAITEALGGVGVAMPYGEVYTALQQGTIDGQENAVINIYPANLQEVQGYMSLTHHLTSFTVLIVNPDWFNALPAEVQAAVQEAATEAMEFQREYSADLTEELISKMRDEGMEIIEPDLQPFREATADIHEEFVGEAFSAELYEAIVGAE